MSETIQELPPLAPAEEVETVEAAEEQPVETGGEEGGGEGDPTPQPEWSAPLQKMQQKQANFQRDIMAKLDELAQARSAPAQQDAKDDLAELLEEAKQMEQYAPGMTKFAERLATKMREALAIKGELPKIQQQQDFNDYLRGKPAGFAEAYREAQEEIISDAKSSGQRITERETQLAMGVWAKQWLKDNKTAVPTPGKRSGKSVIPAPGARRGGGPSLDSALKAGQVPDGRGGFKPGNLLGIK